MGHSRKFLWQGGAAAVCLLVLAILWACSGGSSGSPESVAQSESAFGKVGVLITDAPSHEYEHIWITITEVSLLSADCGGYQACVEKGGDHGWRDDEDECPDHGGYCPDECRDEECGECENSHECERDEECDNACEDVHDCERDEECGCNGECGHESDNCECGSGCGCNAEREQDCGGQGCGSQGCEPQECEAWGEDEAGCCPDECGGETNGCEKVVTVFSSEEGYTLDLLQYRDDDFLLLLNEEVPAGRYCTIRMRISEVRAEGGPCEYLDIKLPGGKIDLNPRGPFDLAENELIYLRLDIDVDKSIHLHTTGSDKCIFRPVVFVDVLGDEEHPVCPGLIRGQVDELHDEYGDPLPESFTLRRQEGGDGDCLGGIRVCLQDTARVFIGEEGFGTPADLAEGQRVTVWGAMSNGCFTASIVILGDCLTMKGTIEEVSGCDEFLLRPDACEEVAGTVRVVLPDGSPVFTGCDTPVEPDALEEGMRVLVAGVFDTDDQVILAALVLMQADETAGTLHAVECRQDGYTFVIETAAGGILEAAVPKSARIALEGDGPIPENLVPLLGCNPYHVRVVTGPGGSTEVLVTPESLTGTVETIYPYSHALQVGGLSVQVMPRATGVYIDEAGDTLVSLDILRPGDTVTCFGLKACSEDLEDFHTFVFLVNQSFISGPAQ